ncbi:MAG: PaaI family thioesterase [Deltaproteobacteria bacterium]|nr:PaaI family thioesterase [Deltaproteobacteria bacterium]
MSERNTHESISEKWVGKCLFVGEGEAKASLVLCAEMQADASGLVHGGFTFGLADYAAMLAVNEPTVVLGSASSRFLAPTQIGEELFALARVTSVKGRKHEVEVKVFCGERMVFEGLFVSVVLDKHVFS